VVDVDEETVELFREALRKLKGAGAELVEIDLGVDFHDLTARTTWPIFFHETLTAIREFLSPTKCPFHLRESMRGSGSTLNVAGHARLCVRAPTTSRMRSTAPR
jgi:Asp-tRNA(Asn)/Glu-tRNA(Gln) amidotransferase A subunit family amidase